MNESKPRGNGLLITIVVLLSVNLLVTIVFLLLYSADHPLHNHRDSSGKIIPLPDGLKTDQERRDFLVNFQRAYNSKNIQDLMAIFGESYQLDLKKIKFEDKIAAIKGVASRINGGAYSFYEVEDLGNGRYKFTLHFSIDTDKGPRNLGIVVTQQGSDKYAIASFSVNTGD